MDRLRPIALALPAAAILAAAFAFPASADTPPFPDHFVSYGQALIGGSNVSPVQQPVIAAIDGNACGEGLTFLITAGPGTPGGDVGKTGYTVDVLPDGTGVGRRPGCGRTGKSIVLYFPVSHRVALQQPNFASGGARTDVDLGLALPYRAFAVNAGADGAR